MAAKKASRRKSGRDAQVEARRKYAKEYYARRKANGGKVLSKGSGKTLARRASFGEEMKAYDDIQTILEGLPSGSRAVVWDYLAQTHGSEALSEVLS